MWVYVLKPQNDYRCIAFCADYAKRGRCAVCISLRQSCAIASLSLRRCTALSIIYRKLLSRSLARIFNDALVFVAGARRTPPITKAPLNYSQLARTRCKNQCQTGQGVLKRNAVVASSKTIVKLHLRRKRTKETNGQKDIFLFDIWVFILYYFELIYTQCPYSHVCTYTCCCVYLIKICQPCLFVRCVCLNFSIPPLNGRIAMLRRNLRGEGKNPGSTNKLRTIVK